MTFRYPVRSLLSFVSLFSFLNGASAQCTNQSPYPQAAVTPDGSGLQTSIDPCNWQTEYGTIIGIVSGGAYQFIYEGGAWITVHQGTYDGPVIGQGASPLTVEAVGTGNLYPHWNTDSLCGVAQVCHGTSVQLLIGGGCTPPVVTTDVVPDCENGQFYIGVVVVSTGDASSVGLSWTVNGGSSNNLSGLQAGTYQLGPFTNGALIDITVVHAEQAACNVVVNDLTSEPCSIQSCGPDTYTHCYGNNENFLQIFQGTSTFPLRLQFNSGSVSSSGNDMLEIRDGSNATDPILFSGVGNVGDLAGVTVLSTNPDHALRLTMVSNSSFSCGDAGVAPPWNYTVGCLDCVLPEGTAGAVSTDCDAQEFTVEVTVSEMGTATSLQIGNSAAVPETTVLQPGTYTAGPFPVGIPVGLSLVNLESTICSIPLGIFENDFCPLMVTCGEPALDQTYCYANSDAHEWLYENTGTGSLAILFSSGTIESSSWDHLTIYDGADDQAPVLFDHNTFVTLDLSGLLAISTGPSLFVKMSSDPSISCATGNQATWNWTVGCLDCDQPEVEYTVLMDCANSVFFIATEITGLGSDSTITITNTGGAPVLNATGIGTYNVGPFPLGADVVVNLQVENQLCAVHSPVITSAPCPVIGCGPYQFDLCYTDNMDTTIVYQSPGTYPIAVLFNSGGIDTFGDFIEVYDGLDYQAPLIYTGNNGGDLTSLQFTSTNPANALCVRFISNAFTSCVTGGIGVPWNWSVSCLDCTNPAADFELVEDCLHHGFTISVNVSSLGSAADLHITDSWSGDTLSGIGLGTSTVGPIPVGQSAHITVLNSANALCRINSEDFTLAPYQCVVTACEPIGVDYCYADADTAWFTYQSGENTPVTVAFAYGQLLDGDEVRIYNGLDDDAQLVYAGNFGGDISGFAISSSNPDNALTFQVISDVEGSCATGEAATAMYWTVGCGLVGIEPSSTLEPAVFPNPAKELARVVLPATSFQTGLLELYDGQGRLVKTQSIPAGAAFSEVEVGGSAPGLYRLVIVIGDFRWTLPLSVSR